MLPAGFFYTAVLGFLCLGTQSNDDKEALQIYENPPQLTQNIAYRCLCLALRPLSFSLMYLFPGLNVSKSLLDNFKGFRLPTDKVAEAASLNDSKS
jgi:hypothetical protein